MLEKIMVYMKYCYAFVSLFIRTFLSISVTEVAQHSLSKTKISTEKVRLEGACESIF